MHRNSVCLMNTNSVWGGGEKWHYETACYLAERDYTVLVIAKRRSDLYHRLKGQKHVTLVSMRINNMSFLNPFKILSIRNILRKNRIYTLFLGLSRDVKLGGTAAKMAGVDQIIYRRGSAVPLKNSIVNRFLFQKVLTHVITNSREIKCNVFKKNPHIIADERVQIIYNGIDLKQWPQSSRILKEREEGHMLILGNAGRLVKQKGQEYLIQIAEVLKRRKIPFKLFIAGSGKLEKSLKYDCQQQGLENEIVFLDFVEDIREFLNSLDIYLSTSLHEGSSHVILEALASGKPVVAFNISSMPEMISDGVSGYLVPIGDVNVFAERIIRLWRNPGEIEKSKDQARRQLEDKFDFYKNMQQLMHFLER
jgi:glycosyltransferase involved in cell wall biosynthesis